MQQDVHTLEPDFGFSMLSLNDSVNNSLDLSMFGDVGVCMMYLY